MRNLAVIGTGYVGLVTGVCLSEVGHHVVCIDVDEEKVKKMKSGIPPIFEPGLEELMIKNIKNGQLHFTTDYTEGLKNAEVIYITVGTPQNIDGSADLKYIKQVAKDIGLHVTHDVIVATKSTVPVGTNELVHKIIQENLKENVQIDIVSNPEFLREGFAIYDTFNNDRTVIGTSQDHAAKIMTEINQPFNVPIFITDIRSAEMIKYASNAFLATKISFINEIALICEKIGANVDDVAYGMGQDSRIGPKFLDAGIGYGGSCFPKDSIALVKMAENVNHSFKILNSVIEINKKQQMILVEKAKERFGSLKGKKCAMLGLSFKPNTDDVRESACIYISKRLIDEGAEVSAYDPIAIENAKKILDSKVKYGANMEETLQDTDFVFILTDWKEFIDFPLDKFSDLMKFPIIFDGRNCYNLEDVKQYPIEYHSIGRASIINK
ncbi:UDP-glucose/GDP-mannose dehydrogenase family protein [Neobacillus sp. 179-C4.2 HS]|uniref:UDP-glucose 6-dehydrogenase n=1 Tax=Neobacillus driksii TaxID=3035913 RepID=A0ABV4YRF6_9BACI|nr:UDP-glucose/GDP-mannose dehydrogenase family protein [Neobacillus sp. 179.-C4.2 HS]MDP5195483.1 UDP-glucose/GDP-mannose dehydrogenase family protein [Neobacillus sp. 179.-C4.2 HS]